MAGREYQRLEPKSEDIGIDAERNDVNPLSGHSGLEITIANVAAVSPDFIDAAQHGQPTLRQTAEFPRLHEHPFAAPRRFQVRRPLVPHVNICANVAFRSARGYRYGRLSLR